VLTMKQMTGSIGILDGITLDHTPVMSYPRSK
jgi:hypothetical protein